MRTVYLSTYSYCRAVNPTNVWKVCVNEVTISGTQLPS